MLNWDRGKPHPISLYESITEDWYVLGRNAILRPYKLETEIEGVGVNNANVNHRLRRTDEQRDQHDQ
jgi:hypothetical protein